MRGTNNNHLASSNGLALRQTRGGYNIKKVLDIKKEDFNKILDDVRIGNSTFFLMLLANFSDSDKPKNVAELFDYVIIQETNYVVDNIYEQQSNLHVSFNDSILSEKEYDEIEYGVLFNEDKQVLKYNLFSIAKEQYVEVMEKFAKHIFDFNLESKRKSSFDFLEKDNMKINNKYLNLLTAIEYKSRDLLLAECLKQNSTSNQSLFENILDKETLQEIEEHGSTINKTKTDSLNMIADYSTIGMSTVIDDSPDTEKLNTFKRNVYDIVNLFTGDNSYAFKDLDTFSDRKIMKIILNR